MNTNKQIRSETQNLENMETNATGKGQQHRKRKKQYFNAIRQQMEFYFGDANLSKDRFLNKLLATDPFVPLNTFMSFNKIKELTHSIEDIQKAIENSEVLELSCDKQSVRRLTEFRQKENIDDFTVYVEALPPNSTHESVKTLFKQFGNVAYVSLPKYRTSGRIKEFAFVEFEDKDSVEQCINAFRLFDGVIGEVSDPEKLKSVTAYVKEQEEMEENEKVTNENENEKENADEAECDTQNDDEGNKVDEVSTTTNVETNENAEIDPDSAVESDVESLASQPPLTKRLKVDNDSPVPSEPKDSEENEEKNSNDLDEKKKKRRTRRRRKPDSTPANNENAFAAATAAVVHHHPHVFHNIPDHFDIGPWNTKGPTNSLNVLRVATKVEWKRLRNKYLMLQREKYAEVKKLLRTQTKSDKNAKKSTLPPMVRPVTMKAKQYTSPPPSKRICTRNINFYGAMGDDHNNAVNTYECSIVDENRSAGNKSKPKKDEKNLQKESQFEFEPGLIVKVNFDQPCVDVTDFKAEMKQYAFVRYVDIKEGQSNAFVRVDASRSAPILIKHCAPNRCQILTGETESEYWAKIARDREQKLSKGVKVAKTRGRKMRNLIKNIAEVNVINGETKTSASHIRFDD